MATDQHCKKGKKSQKQNGEGGQRKYEKGTRRWGREGAGDARDVKKKSTKEILVRVGEKKLQKGATEKKEGEGLILHGLGHRKRDCVFSSSINIHHEMRKGEHDI